MHSSALLWPLWPQVNSYASGSAGKTLDAQAPACCSSPPRVGGTTLAVVAVVVVSASLTSTRGALQQMERAASAKLVQRHGMPHSLSIGTDSKQLESSGNMWKVVGIC